MRRHSLAFANFAIDDPIHSLAVSCTMLFALAELFSGIVIPLSDSFVTTVKRDSDHSYYLEIFFICQYSIAIISIFYLQWYIYIVERCLKRKEMKTKDRQITKLENSSTRNHAEVFTDLDQEKPGLFNPNKNDTDDNSPNDGLINDRIIPLMVNHVNIINLKDASVNSDSTSSSKYHLQCDDSYGDGEGINLYLRLGAVAFGFGVMVHDGFKIADQFRLQKITCHSQFWTPKHILHLTYIFCQTFFVFKYHRTYFLIEVIFRKQKSLLRFILCQLAVTNLCQWFKTVVYEISHELMEHKIKMVHKSKPSVSLNNHTYHHVSNNGRENLSCADQLSYVVSPYLFPCAIEYSLISGAIFFKILQKAGRTWNEKPKYHKVIEEHTSFSECHRSHKGLFVGLLFFMATLVGLATFLLFKSKSSTQTLAVIVYQISEIILLFSSIIALIFAFVQMKVLSFRQLTEEEALDDNLLLIGLAGVFTYNLFLLISTIDSSLKYKNETQWFTKILFLCKSLTEIIQSLLQVLFVLESSRRCAKYTRDIRLKPGRSFVTFLIITNLALWIVSIFEAKRADEHMLFTNYYQKTPWSIITHTLLPLIIFFRFHSTVCLSDIWTQSYKLRI